MTIPNSSLINEAINDLKDAKQYLISLQDEYKDDPELLSFYEPSALEIVRQFEVRLNNVLEQETGVRLNIDKASKEPDIWIRLQGNKFNNGTGPIDAVGTFLHKLNQVSHKVIKLIDSDTKRLAPSLFNLVATAKGSLKLGLSKPNYEDYDNQLVLDLEDPWDQLKTLNQQNEKVTKSLQLLIKALDAENESSMKEIEVELKNQNDVIKLLHYAKDLAPSNRSTIERISFEGSSVPYKQKVVSVDKHTRKVLSERAKVLKKDISYIEGKALIRQQDMDSNTLTARPLILEDNKQFNEVKCTFYFDKSSRTENLLGKFVSISGFLIYGANNQPLRLEIDELTIEEQMEDE